MQNYAIPVFPNVLYNATYLSSKIFKTELELREYSSCPFIEQVSL